MTTIPERTVANSAAEHVSDHNELSDAYNDEELWIPAEAFSALTGSPALTTFVSKYRGWALDASSDEAVYTTISLPPHWSTWRGYILSTAAATGTAVLDLQAVDLSSTDDMNAATYASVTEAKSISITTNLLNWTTIGEATSPAGVMAAIKLVRDADNGSDTLAADLIFLGLHLIKET